MNEGIHPTALVHPEARLADGVRIGPFAIVGERAELGRNTVIAAHAVIHAGSILGDECRVDCHAVIGGNPQDLRFAAETRSAVRLGRQVVVREGVTVHRATREGCFTEVGDGVFLMSNAHVGHDCSIETHAIIASGAVLGGFVEIGAHAFLGGGAAFHQFVRVGESAMVGGGSRCSLDVPPFSMVAERNELVGLNLVGLKRRNFSREAIRAVKEGFAKLYGESGNLRIRAAELLDSPLGEVEEARRYLTFFTVGGRGFARPGRSHRPTDADSGERA